MSDLVLMNGRFLTKYDGVYRFHLGNCFIDDGVISGFDINKVLVNKSYDLNGKYVIPAFFNTHLHLHLGESVFREINGKWSLEKYLSYTEAINNQMTEDERRASWEESASYTINEIIKSGTSTICSARAEMACKYRVKTLSGYPLMNSKKLSSFYNNSLDGFQNFKSNNEKQGIVTGTFLHSLYATTDDYLDLAHKTIDNGANFISIHISETKKSRENEINLYNCLPIKTLIKNGLLTKKTILVHCNYLTEEELDDIARYGSTISICPLSNSFLGEHPINPYNLKKRGINWFVSTDGLATGRSLSLLTQLKALKDIYPAIGYDDLFSSITDIPAARFPVKNYTGNISIGSAADLIILDYNTDMSEIGFLSYLIEHTPAFHDLFIDGCSIK